MEQSGSGGAPSWLPVGRMNGLTDAFFAIIMTLTVLTINLPDEPRATLEQDLNKVIFDLWPQVLVYIITFGVLGFQWVTHHTIYRFVQRIDRTLIWMNFTYLLTISLLPLTTGFLGDFTEHELPIIIYATNMLLLRIMMELQWWYITRDDRLVEDRPKPHYVRAVSIHLLIGSVGFAVVILATLVSTTFGLIVLVLALLDTGINAAWVDRLRTGSLTRP